MSHIHVIAVITAKPGQRGALLKSFQANVPAVLAEDGCLGYEATIDTENAGPAQAPFGPDTFVVVERWASMAHLAAHAVAPHMKAYAAATRDMVADRRIHILSPA
ncbi:MAG: antibiotic biosynthesis monooxygenase [Rhodobacteraceae bacterium]|nr:antibiotic biosynthesis monooxygenase [Paracoccaceae bacterium]